MSRPIKTSHFIYLDFEDAEGNPLPPMRVHYELETWTETHEFGHTEYFSDVHILWADHGNMTPEIAITNDLETRILATIGQ